MECWLFAAAVSFGALAGCTADPAPIAVAASPLAEIDATMHLRGCGFVPSIVFAHPGGPVTIVNLDLVPHRLTGLGVASVLIAGGGGVYSFQAPRAGTTSVHCDNLTATRGQVFVV